MVSSYSTAQLARAAGVTYRQLDYWARAGLVAPSIRDANGSGSQRAWSPDDLDRVRRVAAAARIKTGRLADIVDSVMT